MVGRGAYCFRKGLGLKREAAEEGEMGWRGNVGVGNLLERC